MKSLLRLLVLLLLLTIVAVPLTAQGRTYATPKVNPLHVRTGPGIEYGVIAILAPVGYFPILDRTQNWLLIDLGQAQGWVHKAYVTESDVIFIYQSNVPTIYPAPVVYTVPINSAPTTTYTAPATTYTAPTTTYTVPSSYAVQPYYTAPAVQQPYYSGQADFNSTVGSWSAVNIRRGPDFNYSVASVMPRGDRAVLLARNFNGTWYLVNYNGTQGWVYHAVVAVPPAVNIPGLPVR